MNRIVSNTGLVQCQRNIVARVAAIMLAALLATSSAFAGIFSDVGDAVGGAVGDLVGGAVSGIANSAGEAVGNAAVGAVQGIVDAGSKFVTGQPEHGNNQVTGNYKTTQIVDVKNGIEAIGSVLHVNRAALKDCVIKGDATTQQELHANRLDVKFAVALLNDLQLKGLEAKSLDVQQIINSDRITVTAGVLLGNVAYSEGTKVGGDRVIHQKIDSPVITVTGSVVGLNEAYD